MKTQHEIEKMKGECLKRMNDLYYKKEEYLFDVDRDLFELYDRAYQVIEAQYNILLEVLK